MEEKRTKETRREGEKRAEKDYENQGGSMNVTKSLSQTSPGGMI